MADFLGIELAPAAVRVEATFREAVESLAAHPVSAVAVLDEHDRVVGVAGSEALLRGLFPRYLRELRHTAFARDDPALLERCAREASAQPVRAYMGPPVSVEQDASALHVAEVFLHHDYDAVPVVDRGRFVGMLGRAEFCRAMIARPAGPAGAGSG
jgi:CBS domain-containing protein